MSTQARRRPRLTTAVAGALAVLAVAAPAAGARPYEEVAQRLHDDAAAAARQRSEAPAPTVTRAVEEGFDLGSAAIGAGGAAAVLLLTGASAVSHPHRRLGAVR